VNCNLTDGLQFSAAIEKGLLMALQTLQIQIPSARLQRVRVSALDEARELVTFLLENYIQELERKQLRQAYEVYSTSRTPQEVAEEAELMADFADADAEIDHPVTVAF